MRLSEVTAATVAVVAVDIVVKIVVVVDDDEVSIVGQTYAAISCAEWGQFSKLETNVVLLARSTQHTGTC